jgi:hypothetical protein
MWGVSLLTVHLDCCGTLALGTRCTGMLEAWSGCRVVSVVEMLVV